MNPSPRMAITDLSAARKERDLCPHVTTGVSGGVPPAACPLQKGTGSRAGSCGEQQCDGESS